MINAGSATVDVLDLRNPAKPTKFGSLDIVADLAPGSVGAANLAANEGRRRHGELPADLLGKPLLIVGNVVSGTTTVCEFR